MMIMIMIMIVMIILIMLNNNDNTNDDDHNDKVIMNRYNHTNANHPPHYQILNHNNNHDSNDRAAFRPPGVGCSGHRGGPEGSAP